jgi:DNA replication protein DnaC
MNTTGSVTSNDNQPLTATAASRYQQLRSHLAELRLHTAAEHLPTVLDQASSEGLSVTAALERLLALEVDATEARRLAGRLRFACLPTPASLDDFDYDAAAGLDRHLIAELGTCRYLDTATNVIMIGPPGVGKTHLAVGLARAAAHTGYRTYFTTAADLAARCHRAAIEGRWATTMRFYAGPTLLAIDELGYLPLPAEAASALFQVVSQRYLKTSIVITTNRGVGSWGEILGDTTCRRRHARPATPPIRRDQPRRRFLPTPRPPRPQRTTPPNNHRQPPTATLNTASR